MSKATHPGRGPTTGGSDEQAATRPEPGELPTNPALDVDDVVHQRVRLAILVVAHEASRVEFTYLRDALDLTAGNLSRHLSTLVDAGLVGLTKDERGARPRTWVRITPKGRKALAREMALLDALVRRVRPSPDDRHTGLG